MATRKTKQTTSREAKVEKGGGVRAEAQEERMEQESGARAKAKRGARARAKVEKGSGAQAVGESPLAGDPLRDRLVELDPAAPVVCMVTREVQEPGADAMPWADDAEMLGDAFAWAAARMRRLAAQCAVSERLGVTTEIDEEVRRWEKHIVSDLPLPEVLVRAEAQAKVLHGEWKGKPMPAEGVGRPALASEFLFLDEDYVDASHRRDDAQSRLVKLSRLRIWLMRALQREVRASRRLLERRHATRATGWVPFLDSVGDAAALTLLERAMVLLALGASMDWDVRSAADVLAQRSECGRCWGISAGHVVVFAGLDLREQLALRCAMGEDAPLHRFRLLKSPSWEWGGCSGDSLDGIQVEVSDALVERLAASMGVRAPAAL